MLGDFTCMSPQSPLRSHAPAWWAPTSLLSLSPSSRGTLLLRKLKLSGPGRMGDPPLCGVEQLLKALVAQLSTRSPSSGWGSCNRKSCIRRGSHRPRGFPGHPHLPSTPALTCPARSGQGRARPVPLLTALVSPLPASVRPPVGAVPPDSTRVLSCPTPNPCPPWTWGTRYRAPHDCGDSTGCAVRLTRVQIPTLLLTSCGAFSKLLAFSEPPFLHL